MAKQRPMDASELFGSIGIGAPCRWAVWIADGLGFGSFQPESHLID